jgi:hypothetical protein
MTIVHTPIPISEVFEWAEDFEDSNFLDEWKRAIENGDEDASSDERVLVFEITKEDFEYTIEWGDRFTATDGSDYTEDIEKALKRGRHVYKICDDHNHYTLGYVVEKRRKG